MVLIYTGSSEYRDLVFWGLSPSSLVENHFTEILVGTRAPARDR